MTGRGALARLPIGVWPVLAAVAAMVPVAGAFSTTHAFHVRDLALFFWPRHLWLRQTVARGDWPWWDPHPGAGQSAVADALNQFFLLPVTLIRLVLPDVAGFNFWVAAPFPVAAIGAWFWLTRHVSPAAACVGAVVFAVAGPVVSAGNFPNLSWAAACIPWALWAADRMLERAGARRVAVLAAVMGLQAVAGEPVTLAGTGALLLAWAAFGDRVVDWRHRARRLLPVGTALVAGALLSAVQMMPLGWAAMHSPRGGDVNSSFWSLHPLELLGTVVAHVFGHPYDGQARTMPWLFAFHQREPLLPSVYIGLGVLALAAVPARDPQTRRRRLFWWVAGAVALLCAFGEHTPAYPALQAALPLLQSLRYPVKYTVIGVVALTALAAGGADVLLAHARSQVSMRRPVGVFALLGVTAGVAFILGAASVAWPDALRSGWEALGNGLRLLHPREAAEWIVRSSPPRFLGVGAMSAGLLLLFAVVWMRHRGALAAAVALCGLAAVDPLVVNRDLNPTMPAAAFGPPSWIGVAERHPGDRVYVGGRVVRSLRPPRLRREALDVPDDVTTDAELSYVQGNTTAAAEFAYVPSPWGLREPISFDLPALYPREYTAMIGIFARVPREDRLRFVRRSGVRYCFVAEPPHPGAEPLTPMQVGTGPMALYECETDPQRVYITPSARVAPELSGQLRPLFTAEHDPHAEVLLEREPPAPAGRAGQPQTPHARIAGERNTELLVRAAIGPGGGYLNVLDSYDPGWQVEVDGDPATLLRANGIYRAVRLTPGEHEVRFRYRPLPFLAGLGVTLVTALVLLLACAREWLTARGAARRMRLAATAS